MAKKQKLLLTLTNPPEGMNSSQTFDGQKHLDEWLDQNKEKLNLKKVSDTSIEFGEKNEKKEGETKQKYKERLSTEGEGTFGTGVLTQV